jgi:hypothetical protein
MIGMVCTQFDLLHTFAASSQVMSTVYSNQIREKYKAKGRAKQKIYPWRIYF